MNMLSDAQDTDWVYMEPKILITIGLKAQTE